MKVRIEWDPAEAASNKLKHAVTFAEAASCFDDEHGVYCAYVAAPDR